MCEHHEDNQPWCNACMQLWLLPISINRLSVFSYICAFFYLLLIQVRVVLKYRHCDGNLCIKVTDDAVCLQYKTDQAQDVKKIEKLHGKLMRLMVSKESGAMEMD
uniref:Signal recognition particle 9 kDa protein n=1 Tax=Oncorhynchus tshawytscha TaxID=74940 RepID=A0AAZ3NPH3_ONCTS